MNFQPMIFDKAQSYFKPDPNHPYNKDQQYVLDQQFLAFLVGVVAVGLPIVMGMGVVFGTCFFHSISHFYYAQFLGGVFIAALVFIGTFLLAYRGESANESLLATGAGFCAYGIALFPTDGRGCEKAQYSGRILADQINVISREASVTIEAAIKPGQFFELFPAAGWLHFISALLLFSFLAFYSFFIFTRVIDDQQCKKDKTLTEVKKIRNGLYRASGTVIVICILAIGINALNSIFGDQWLWWNDNNLTFWFETFALCAFGLSWLVKGRFYGYLLLDPRDRMVKK